MRGAGEWTIFPLSRPLDDVGEGGNVEVEGVHEVRIGRERTVGRGEDVRRVYVNTGRVRIVKNRTARGARMAGIAEKNGPRREIKVAIDSRRVSFNHRSV